MYTLFSSFSNVESTETINAYGIKIAEAVEVIEYEERTKNITSFESNNLTQTTSSLLGKRSQPEPYIQSIH